jgi:hypothetical protein
LPSASVTDSAISRLKYPFCITQIPRIDWTACMWVVETILVSSG